MSGKICFLLCTKGLKISSHVLKCDFSWGVADFSGNSAMTRARAWLGNEIMKSITELWSASASALQCLSQFFPPLLYCYATPRSRATLFGWAGCALSNSKEQQRLCECAPWTCAAWQPPAGAWSPRAISEFGLLSTNQGYFFSLC